MERFSGVRVLAIFRKKKGLSSDAVCTVLADKKLAIWFRLAPVCAGACSVLISNLPNTRSCRKSFPSYGGSVVVPVVSGVGGIFLGRIGFCFL